MTEAELKAEVVTLAHKKGWLVYHVQQGRIRSAGDHGYPDLTLARLGQVRFIELKTDHGNLSVEQWKWFRELASLATVIRPGDLADGRVEVLLA